MINNIIKKNIFPIAVIVLGLTVSGIMLFGSSQSNKGFISQNEAAKIASEFVNNTLLQGQATASVSKISEESGLYKIELLVQGSQFDSFMTKDGKFFFPEGLNVENPSIGPIAPTPSQGGTGMVGGC